MSETRLKCSNCGHSNTITQMFCASCGSKLDMSSIKSGSIKRQRSGGGSFGGSVTALVRIAIIAVLVLLLWPVSPDGDRGGRQLALSMNHKLESLRAALAGGGQQAVVVEEAEANAYLDSLTRSEEGTSGQLPVREANLDFTSYRVTATVVAALGPLPLSYQVTGVPSTDDGFSFRVTGARIGHMPLPGPAANLVLGKIARVFSGLEHERDVVEHLDRIALGDGAVKVGVL